MEWPTSEGVFISESILESIFTLTFVASFLGREGGRKMHWITRRVHLPLIMKRTRLSNFTFTFHFHALEEEMETHSSVLAWRIPGMGEPGGLLSMGSHRVGHD